MKIFVSGESDARGFVGNSPHIAVDPAAVAIRRPELLGTLGIWQGIEGPGVAWQGLARQGMEYGAARRGMARLGKAGNKGGQIRKNNKPTQPNGNNTFKRIDELR